MNLLACLSFWSKTSECMKRQSQILLVSTNIKHSWWQLLLFSLKLLPCLAPPPVGLRCQSGQKTPRRARPRPKGAIKSHSSAPSVTLFNRYYVSDIFGQFLVLRLYRLAMCPFDLFPWGRANAKKRGKVSFRAQ